MKVPGFNGIAIDTCRPHLKYWLHTTSDNFLICVLISVSEFSQSNHNKINVYVK